MGYQAQQHVLRTFEHLLTLLPENDRAKPQILLVAGEHTGYRNDTDRELSFRQESNFFYLTGCNVPSSFLVATYHPTRPDGSTTTLTTTLFIPKAEQADIMWSIPPPDLATARTMFDATNIENPAAFPLVISTLLKDTPDAVVHTLPKNSPLFPSHLPQYLNYDSPNTVSYDRFLLPALQRARLIKDADEIALIRKANEISSRAHETVMRVLGLAVKNKIARGEGAGVTRPLLPGEWLIEKEAEAEAIFVASCRREGSIHQAYLPIVAASTRAATLHYCCNDKEFAWGPIGPHDHINNQPLSSSSSSPSPTLTHNHNQTQTHTHPPPPHTTEIHPQVLLIDAGCEFNNYASDITRTIPLGNSGHFTTPSRNIYDLVLSMQSAALALIKPGVHWDTVHLECHKVLVRGFLKLGLFKSKFKEGCGSDGDDGGEEEILKSGVSTAFFPHGLGHSLGLDVHDVPEASRPGPRSPVEDLSVLKDDDAGHERFYTYLRLRLPLEVGMVVTVEPGIYFHTHLLKPVLDSKYIDLDVLKEYESVGGVRIEDVVVITPDGYENLTTVRSERSWVEGVCSGEL